MSINYGKWDLSAEDVLLLLGGGTAVGLVAGWLFYDSLLLGAAVGALCFAFTPKYRSWRIQRRQRELLLQFRDVLYSVSSSISVGRSMSQALEESIHFWEGTYSERDLMMAELAAMVRKIRESNESDVVVLRDFAQRSGLPEVADFVGVYENCKGSGANLIQAVNRAAMVIGDKITLERELHMLMAQKRFESRIVMGSPFVVLLFLKIFSPDYLLPLTSSSQGRLISTLALALIAAACLLMERVNRFEF